LILIGGRGCGKSALCKRLVASDPRFTLRSLDDMIVEEAGMSIPEIVETRGWRWFRDAEFSACERVAAGARERRASGDTNPNPLANPRWTLVDAGGGVVVDLDDDGNEKFSARKVDALRGAVVGATGARENVLVYLRRDVGYLINRTSGDRNRPRLSDDVSFAKLMERRAPWYFRAADYVVDAAGGVVESRVKTKKAIKEEVLEYFYAETGGWPVDDEREQREERETNGEEAS
jgi:shikimate kinase